jgi:hypothetical protein
LRQLLVNRWRLIPGFHVVWAFLILEIGGFAMAGEPGHEELEQRGKRSENAQEGDKEVNVGYAGSDSGFTTKPKSGDRLAIIVFSVAVVILVVSSFFLIKNIKPFFEKPTTSDIERVINTKKEQIKERFKEKIRPLAKQPQDSKPKQQVSRKQPMTTKLRLPRSATNAELTELVEKKGHIKILRMPVCLQITDISPLSKLTHLEQLNMEGCKNIRSIAPLSGLKGLRKLKTSRCISIEDISPILHLTSLTELAMPPMVTNEQLTQLVRHLPNLQSLALQNCKLITDVSPVSQLRNLKSFYISGAKDLRDISSLAELPGLQNLYLTFTTVEDFSPISQLTQLKHLTLFGSQNLTDLSALANLKNLKSLGLNGSQGVSDLTPIAELTNLTRLSLANLKELRDLSPLVGLKGLKHLDLVNSTNIPKLQINSIRRALPKCRIVDPYHYHRRRTG